MIALIQPRPEELQDALRAAKPWIDAGCEHSGGALTFALIAQRVMAGANQLWALVEMHPPAVIGAVVTALEPRESGKVAWIICAGAKSTEARSEVQPILEDWARSEGCKEIVMWGRRGWWKKLPDWKARRIELVKEL